MKLSIVIPALNEEQAIGATLIDLHREVRRRPEWSPYEVLVADNGSTDRTAEVALANGARVVQASRRGYGSACLAAMAAMQRSECVLFMDADRSDVVEDMGVLIDPLTAGAADMVIGVREPIEGGALTPAQRFGNALACRLMERRWGFRYHDLGPFRAITGSALSRLDMTDPDFGWTIEMQIKAIRRGLRIAERPVRYRARVGRSKISGTVRRSLLAGWTILRTIAMTR